MQQWILKRVKDNYRSSKGFRQRVGLAQALIHDPEILVLDEPVRALDPRQRKEVRDLIQKLAEGQRLLYCRHTY